MQSPTIEPTTTEYTFIGDPMTIYCAILSHLGECGLYNDDINLISTSNNDIKGELIYTDGIGFNISYPVIGDALHKKVMYDLFNQSAREL